MNPIIDPMLFYWMDVLVSLKVIFILVAVCGGGGGLVFLFFGWIENDWSYDYEPEKKIINILIKVIASGLVVGFLTIFIPSEATMYKMLIAKNVTPDNIETVQGELTDLVDYIIDKIDELKD